MEECHFSDVACRLFFKGPCHPVLYGQWLKHADASLPCVWLPSSLWWWGQGWFSAPTGLCRLRVAALSCARLAALCWHLCHREYFFSSYWRLPPMWNKRQSRHLCCHWRRGGRSVQMKCETKATSPTTFITALSWPRCPWSSRGWRGWVTSSISNVIVGSQFHQGALLAITSWEQNNPALSQLCCPPGQPAGGRNRRAQRPCWMMEAHTRSHTHTHTHTHTVLLYIIFLVSVRTKGDS